MFGAFVCWNILSSHGLHDVATAAGVVTVTNAGTACSLNAEQSEFLFKNNPVVLAFTIQLSIAEQFCAFT